MDSLWLENWKYATHFFLLQKNNNREWDFGQTKLPGLLSGWCDNWTWANQQSESHHNQNHDLVIFLDNFTMSKDHLMSHGQPHHKTTSDLRQQPAAHLLRTSAASMKSNIAKLIIIIITIIIIIITIITIIMIMIIIIIMTTHLKLFVQTAAHLLTASAASMKSNVAKLQ